MPPSERSVTSVHTVREAGRRSSLARIAAAAFWSMVTSGMMLVAPWFVRQPPGALFGNVALSPAPGGGARRAAPPNPARTGARGGCRTPGEMVVGLPFCGRLRERPLDLGPADVGEQPGGDRAPPCPV